jgi:pantothenate kinase
LDIGGSLIKLVYFSKDPLESGGGKLHFVKFETSMIEDCMAFIENKRLHKRKNSSQPIRVKATGGGAFKFAEVSFRQNGYFFWNLSHCACSEFLIKTKKIFGMYCSPFVPDLVLFLRGKMKWHAWLKGAISF